ncbi:MAG: mediator of RNA polymerase II transcription subunit 8 [Alyxoria varia]|nr:MAG: mediator of RNA polymerase II transcription subunit 8 [Alyxoria varia]
MSDEPQVTHPSKDEIQALEQTRQRLFHLNGTLQSLHKDLTTHDPLPPWPDLHGKAHIASMHLQSMVANLDAHRGILGAAHAYPIPSFPSRNHENVVNQLLRKKLEPPVENWIEEGHNEAAGLHGKDGTMSDCESRQYRNLGREQFEKLWAWAATDPLSQIGEIPWGIDYTMEELQRDKGVVSVSTGLDRKLISEERHGDDEDEEEQATPQTKPETEKAAPPTPNMPVETILKVAVGANPT